MSTRGPTDAGPLHASCVAQGDQGILILGASGRGKSALALELISRGAELVADDRVLLSVSGDRLTARAPDTIRGRIEARGVGILTLPFRQGVAVALAVDLDKSEHARLPEPHVWSHAGITLPCLHDPAMTYFPAALLAYLTHMGQSE